MRLPDYCHQANVSGLERDQAACDRKARLKELERRRACDNRPTMEEMAERLRKLSGDTLQSMFEIFTADMSVDDAYRLLRMV